LIISLGFQYKVLHLLTDLKDGIETICGLLKAENSSFQIAQCDNLNEFKDFDQSLDNKDMEKQVKLNLVNVGGASCHAEVRGILLKLMSNKLMALFNMRGHGKEAFAATNLFQVITDCISEKYDENQIYNEMALVLKRAPDRKGGGGRSVEPIFRELGDIDDGTRDEGKTDNEDGETDNEDNGADNEDSGDDNQDIAEDNQDMGVDTENEFSD